MTAPNHPAAEEAFDRWWNGEEPSLDSDSPRRAAFLAGFAAARAATIEEVRKLIPGRLERGDLDEYGEGWDAYEAVVRARLDARSSARREVKT